VEGLSISLLEAMACGVACLATDVGADGEVLKGAGIVLDTKGLITQLKTLLPVLRDHPELTTILGQKARQRVLDSYTLSKNIDRLQLVYQEVLAKNNLLLATFTKDLYDDCPDNLLGIYCGNFSGNFPVDVACFYH